MCMYLKKFNLLHMYYALILQQLNPVNKNSEKLYNVSKNPLLLKKNPYPLLEKSYLINNY